MRPPRLVTLDYEGLAQAVRAKRGDSSLREVVRETTVTASTLSRIERALGDYPDLETYINLCDWLGVPLEKFIIRWKVSKP